jgi:hypothetical protein
MYRKYQVVPACTGLFYTAQFFTTAVLHTQSHFSAIQGLMDSLFPGFVLFPVIKIAVKIWNSSCKHLVLLFETERVGMGMSFQVF